MSRLARGLAWSFAAFAASWATPARTQTIADYSRVQRARIENAMSQSAARSAGMAASANAAAAPALGTGSAPVVARPRAAAPTSLPLSMSMPRPTVVVSGVFASGAISLAEIVVDATAYLVQPGQRVPGTGWQVDTVEIDRVVLSRRGAPIAAHGERLRRVFLLQSMR